MKANGNVKEHPRRLQVVDDERDIELRVEPFKLWLKERLEFYGDTDAFCSLIGIAERQVYDYIKDRRQFVRLTVADRALTNEGSTHLCELWPELYPDVDTSFARELRAA